MNQQLPDLGSKFQILFLSIVRTIVPLIVGQAVRILAGWEIYGGEELTAALEMFLTTLFATLYYVGARLLETYVAPMFGWLLGAPKAPTGYASVDSAE